MLSLRLFLAGSLALAVLAPSGDARQAEQAFEHGVEAYRRGAYAEAEAFWRDCLDEPLSDSDRARVAYDLGNATWRQGEVLEAVGWYSASLRLEPRRSEVWSNLELARSSAELPPADRGDLRSTAKRLLTAWTPGERRAIVLFAVLPLLLAFLGEALRGGRAWRLAVCGCGLLLLMACLPWAYGYFARTEDPLLVVRTPAVPLRSEPRQALAPIAQLDPGERVERIDALPGWIRVETDAGARGWVQAEALFSLQP